MFSRRPVFPLPSVRGHKAVLRDRLGRRDRLTSVWRCTAMALNGRGEGCRRSVLGVASVVDCLGAGEARGDPRGDGDSKIDMIVVYRLWWIRVEQRCHYVGQKRRWRGRARGMVFVMLQIKHSSAWLDCLKSLLR